MDVALDIQNLRKVFGQSVVLDSLTMAVPHGAIFGFLGPNGAGKTTTIRIVTGLARATSGSVRIFGRALGDGIDVRQSIGFLPDVPGFYDWMTATEFLTFAGRLFGLEGARLDERVAGLTELAGLGGVTTRIGGYSRGMKQRLGLAQAMINAPKLLILDEPTSALDPIGRREMLEMIASLRGRATVLFSTHILADVERVCDTAAILDRGRLMANAPVADLKARTAAQRVTVEVDGALERLVNRLRGASWLTAIDIENDVAHLTVTDRGIAAREIPRAAVEADVGLLRLESEETRLEDVFVSLVGKG